MGIEVVSDGKKNSSSIPVFVSSTYEDLKEYRREIYDLLLELRLEPHGMEAFGSRNEAPLQTCLDEVSRCKIYIGILGMKYGSLEENTQKSFTELEYEQAVESHAYILFYLIDEDNALVHPKYVDTGENASKLKEFKARVKRSHTVYFFKSNLDLKLRIEEDLRRELFDKKSIDTGIESVGDDIAEHPIEGEIALTASGNGYYNIGEKILLSGVNTDSSDVYLIVTGPSINSDGGMLGNLDVTPISSQPRTFTRVPVDHDDTWEYEWDTSKVAKHLATGNYTIFAVSQPFSKGEMHKAKYSSVEIRLNNPYIIASTNSSAIAQGDDLVIAGIATGNPSHVYVWIFGDDYRLLWQPVMVAKDGTYQFRLSTKQFTTGQYFVIVQHPMHNPLPSVRAARPGSDKGPVLVGRDERVVSIDFSSINGSDAAASVINLLGSHEIDDTYTKLSFLVNKPWINILSVDSESNCNSISVIGHTNLAAGNDLILLVTPANFKSEPMTRLAISGLVSFFGGKNAIFKAVRVESGDPFNVWSVDVDRSQLPPGEYKFAVIFTATETSYEKVVRIGHI